MRLVFVLLVGFFSLGKAQALELDIQEMLFPEEITGDMKYMSAFLDTQLGNLCFSTATAVAYALDNGYAFAIDPSFKERYPVLFRKFPVYNVKRPSNILLHDATNFYISKINESTLISGYSNSDFWFIKHKDVIAELFKPTDEMKVYLEKKYSEFLRKDNKYVGLHLRTLVQKQEKNWFNEGIFQSFATSPEFYTEAMNLFPEDSVFVVFSDNIKVAKKLLSPLRRKFIFQEDSSYVEDFYLMSMMERMIIPCSTFASFACFINTNPDKVIVKPENNFALFMFDPSFVILNTKHSRIGIAKWYKICQREFCRLGFDK